MVVWEWLKIGKYAKKISKAETNTHTHTQKTVTVFCDIIYILLCLTFFGNGFRIKLIHSILRIQERKERPI